jgi:hypothetical protein
MRGALPQTPLEFLITLAMAFGLIPPKYYIERPYRRRLDAIPVSRVHGADDETEANEENTLSSQIRHAGRNGVRTSIALGAGSLDGGGVAVASAGAWRAG